MISLVSDKGGINMNKRQELSNTDRRSAASVQHDAVRMVANINDNLKRMGFDPDKLGISPDEEHDAPPDNPVAVVLLALREDCLTCIADIHEVLVRSVEL